MPYRAPFRLLRDGQPFGTVVSYGYETPWAVGWLEADDPGEHARCDAAFALRDWLAELPDDLPDAEADARYARECDARGLTEAEVDRRTGAAWSLVDGDGHRHPAYALSFTGDGFITWRW